MTHEPPIEDPRESDRRVDDPRDPGEEAAGGTDPAADRLDHVVERLERAEREEHERRIRSRDLATGLVLGVGIGVVGSLLLRDWGVGLSIGVALGTALGILLHQLRTRRARAKG